MASASWTSATNASTASWSENQTRADLAAAATAYDDSTIAYDSTAVYWDGYNPTTTTPEGETGATWALVSET